MSYIRNQAVGSGEAPYVYITRRTYDRARRRRDAHLHGRAGVAASTASTTRGRRSRGAADVLDSEVRPFAQPARPVGQPYDFHWHGLMGYMDGMVRVIGPHPRGPRCSTTWAATASASSRPSTAAARSLACSVASSSAEHLRPAGMSARTLASP